MVLVLGKQDCAAFQQSVVRNISSSLGIPGPCAKICEQDYIKKCSRVLPPERYVGWVVELHHQASHAHRECTVAPVVQQMHVLASDMFPTAVTIF